MKTVLCWTLAGISVCGWAAQVGDCQIIPREQYEREIAEAEKARANFAKKHPLGLDLRLRKTFDVKKCAGFGQLMEQMREATGLDFTLADELKHHDPVLGFVDQHNAPAYWVMEGILLYDLHEGRWVKTDDGYRLEGISRTLQPPPTPRTYTWAWATGAAMLTLAAAGGAFVIYRRRSKQPAASPDKKVAQAPTPASKKKPT